MHSYERTNPVYNYVNNQCGIVYITIGDAGNSEGLSGIRTANDGSIYESAHQFPCCPPMSLASDSLAPHGLLPHTHAKSEPRMGKLDWMMLAKRVPRDRQCMCPVFEDFNGGCPNRLNSYRPSYMKSLNPSVDLWSYYNLSATFQVHLYLRPRSFSGQQCTLHKRPCS